MKRSRLRPVSAKRRRQQSARDACRAEVLRRANGRCEARGLTPVECRGKAADVHELGRGPYREKCWLNPDFCLALCRPCHTWIGEHGPEAQVLGLCWGSDTERILKEHGLLKTAAVDIGARGTG